MVKFVLLEPCDFDSYPIGGQLSFAKQLMQAFGNEIALVGYAQQGDPVGKWFKKEIDGVTYDYFALFNTKSSANKPIVPLRMQNLFWFSYYAKAILKYNNSNWFIQAPEILIPASRINKGNICYMFPGVENPLEKPRYRWGQLLSTQFNKQFFHGVNQANTLLACADEFSINKMISRNKGLLQNLNIKHFPTRYDSSVFYPSDKTAARTQLNIPIEKTVVMCSGRINKVKGWDLILDAFKEFREKNANSLLIYVGNGEDAAALKEKISRYQLEKVVQITGFKSPHEVASYLNCCDVYVVGSENEGWSIAMLEALACGKPIVSTLISGATTLIEQDKNGYIVDQRTASVFAKKIELALSLAESTETSVRIAERYTLSGLKQAVEKAWF